MKKSIVLFLIFFTGLFFAVRQQPGFETDILKAVLDENTQTSSIFNINKYLNSDIKVIFERDDAEQLKSDCNNFCREITEQNSGRIISLDFHKYLELLNNHPDCFLTDETRNLLKHKEYKQVRANSLKLLYNPMGIPVISIDKDPYLFVTDYVLSNFGNYNINNGKFYSILCVKTNDTGKIISLAEKYNAYLTGTPVHSYKTAQKSALQINIFCTLGIIFIILLCRQVFNSYKIIIPVLSSIIFGMLCGLIAISLLFESIHILAVVFGTSLIGIGIDYSLHYYANTNHDKTFYKSLTTSMLTTVIAFLFLLLPDINLLNQISVYTISGLIGIYLYVLTVLPLFPLNSQLKLNTIPKINLNKKYFLMASAGIIILGLLIVKPDDSIKNLYKPSGKLKQAEIINQKLTNPENKKVSFVIVKSTEQEEIVTEILNKHNIDYVCKTKFIPSAHRQRENIKLIHELYNDNLNDYAEFLTPVQKEKLLARRGNIVTFDLTEFNLDNDKSVVISYNLNPSVLKDVKNIEIIDIQKDISDNLKICRKQIQKIIPALFICMFLFLYCVYRNKAVKIIIPSLIGVGVGITLSMLFGNSFNIFTILSIFLIIGFTTDYSIFISNGDNSSNTAVFCSCLTSVFSFILLSFASFKLISSIGLLLAIGISASYISSCVLFDETEKI